MVSSLRPGETKFDLGAGNTPSMGLMLAKHNSYWQLWMNTLAWRCTEHLLVTCGKPRELFSSYLEHSTDRD